MTRTTPPPAPARALPSPRDWPAADGDDAIVASSATDLARRIASGALTSERVVRAFLARIARVGDAGNAFALVDAAGALEGARDADAARARGELRGPLHGVPVTVKDTIATRGLRTTAGDPSLAGWVPDEDAAIVARLRRAGAIVLGKTNAARMAMDMQTTNPLFGTTPNPWNPERTIGGSSGGCASAVATHLSPLSFGSDLAGSIRLPAAYAGVTGLRPTRAAVSMRGHVPPRPGEVDGIRAMAVLGPIARSVDDLALALSAIAGPCDEDATPAPLPDASGVPKSVAGLRVAYAGRLGGVPVSRAVERALARVVASLRDAGASVEPAEPAGFSCERTWETWGALVGMQGGYERSNFARRVGRLFAQRHVEPVAHLRRVLGPVTVEGYMRALTEQAAQATALERFLAGFDAWIVPVASVEPFPHHAPARRFGDFPVYDAPLRVDGAEVPYYVATQAYTTLFSVTEGPVVALPAGLTEDGLPVGFQLVGRRFDDRRLLAVARLIEPLLERPRLAV